MKVQCDIQMTLFTTFWQDWDYITGSLFDSST